MFAWMRPNDLVWNYWVNNYLLGNDPPAFDILYWNADTTRLPARLHSRFPRSASCTTPSAQPGVLTVAGTPIDLSQVTCDSFIVGGHHRPHHAVAGMLCDDADAGRADRSSC